MVNGTMLTAVWVVCSIWSKSKAESKKNKILESMIEKKKALLWK